MSAYVSFGSASRSSTFRPITATRAMTTRTPTIPNHADRRNGLTGRLYALGCASMARKVSVAIVGAGFGGVATAVKLKERRPGRHRHPRARRPDRRRLACEHLPPASRVTCRRTSTRCRSHRTRTGASASQPETRSRRTSKDVADRFGVTPHIRFNADVECATFDEESGRWRVEVAGGEDVEAEVLITACGQLCRP